MWSSRTFPREHADAPDDTRDSEVIVELDAGIVNYEIVCLILVNQLRLTFNLVARLAEFVCLLDLLVSVEEYKLDGKKPWITFQDEFISQAEAAGMTETIKDINDWMTHRRNRDTLSKLLGKRYIKS